MKINLYQILKVCRVYSFLNIYKLLMSVHLIFPVLLLLGTNILYILEKLCVESEVTCKVKPLTFNYFLAEIISN